MEEKIQTLLYSGSETNVELAIALLQSQGIPFDIEAHQRLMEWYFYVTEEPKPSTVYG